MRYGPSTGCLKLTASRLPRDQQYERCICAMAPAPYSVRLDADTARRFAETGTTLLFLGVPKHTVIGIDQQVRNVVCLQARNSQARAKLECVFTIACPTQMGAAPVDACHR